MDLETIHRPDFKIINYEEYISSFSEIVSQVEITTQSQQKIATQVAMELTLNLLISCREKNGTIFVIGNGGSAAIASHVLIDLINMGKVRAMSMLDPATTTCISNDYGYEKIYEKQISQFARPEDLLIAISSSGNSKNIVNAATLARKLGVSIITLTGFSGNNALRQLGDYNFWLNSTDYGKVETGHAFLSHYLTDRLREIA